MIVTTDVTSRRRCASYSAAVSATTAGAMPLPPPADVERSRGLSIEKADCAAPLVPAIRLRFSVAGVLVLLPLALLTLLGTREYVGRAPLPSSMSIADLRSLDGGRGTSNE